MCGCCLTVSSVERIAKAFAVFVERQGVFFRTSTRDNKAVAGRYLHGLAQAQDCTFETMAAVVEAGCAQQFQHFISNAPWDHAPVIAQLGKDADRLLGGKLDSSLLIDETSFPKQGVRSVGVSRQWSGRLGKIDMANSTRLLICGFTFRNAGLMTLSDARKPGYRQLHSN
jgi:SRSO17 transposase